MFRLESKSKLRLHPPEFVCDKPIHKQIEPPLPCTHFFMLILGSAGSGKTSMLVNLLTSKQAYKKVFHSVHVIMPSQSVASLKKNIFKGHPRMHDDLSLLTLDRIIEKIKISAEEGHSSLLVMDDVTASLKNKDIQTMLKSLIFNRRHLRTSIIILAQTYTALPLPVRKTVSHFIAYSPRNKKEFSSVFEELVFLEKDTASALQRFVFDKPYTFLYGDVNTHTLYKNFDMILIKEGDAKGENQIEKETKEQGQA